MRQSRPSILLTSTALLATALLAGCVPTEEPPAPSSTATSPSPTPSASATPEPTPTAEIIPLDIACDQLIGADALYTIDPNLALLGTFEPAAGTPAAEVVAAGGFACRWTHETSGATIDIAVAQLPETVATGLKNGLVTTSNSVPTYGVEGYFMVAGGAGQAQAFPDPYWVTAVSPMFLEPGDAAPYVAAAIAGLG